MSFYAQDNACNIAVLITIRFDDHGILTVHEHHVIDILETLAQWSLLVSHAAVELGNVSDAMNEPLRL